MLSETFSRRIVGTFGQAGTEWLQRLPTILADLASRWKINLETPFADLSYNYVAPATWHDGAQVVLKAGVPNRELRTEIAALRTFDGEGAVRLLAAEPDLGALLLERLQPGTPVLQLTNDEQATAIAAQVMQQLWKPAPANHIFPSVSDWAAGLGRLWERFGGSTGPFPHELVEAAESHFRELIGTTQNVVLLHGDLHHWNILSDQRRPWLAIDPKGVIGEPAYEVGAWLRNPFPQILEMANPQEIISRRINQFEEILGFEHEHIFGWAVAQAVLSAWWSYEERDPGWQAGLAIAELISGIK
jgi:streptomycin 6-kinase